MRLTRSFFKLQWAEANTVKMAGRRCSVSSPISIGSCKVEIEGGNFVYEWNGQSIILSSSNDARLRIYEDRSKEETPRKYYSRSQSRHGLQAEGTRRLPLADHVYLLLNPRDVDSRSKFLLQEALKIYTEELPTMNYDANTGKESQFLERCLSSGKYSTLIRSPSPLEGSRKVIAAVTFQIISVDAQFAEIPLAAVTSNFQRKGIGSMMYEELKERLRSVGISSIFCWADKESEQFWVKQGFISVGEVDSKGKAHKLPVRADIRRALCFPCDATLMVAHLKKDIVSFVESSRHTQTFIPSKSKMIICRCPHDGASRLGETGEMYTSKTSSSEAIDKGDHIVNNTQHLQSMKDFPVTGVRNANDVTENKCHNNEGFFSSVQNEKKLVWEASVSSLKSKRVKGNVPDDCMTSLNYDPLHVQVNDAYFDGCSLDASGCAQLVKKIPKDNMHCNSKSHTQRKRSALESANQGIEGSYPRIMFMNIADDDKRSRLKKIVEKLGGSVTSIGSTSTHILTGKARRTLNFCLSLCSGTWIVSPSWLKSSFREGKFLDESEHILEDEEYQLKYKCKLRDAVTRAKANPHSLLRGYQVWLSRHIQPSINVLSPIILSAGGSVTCDLRSPLEPSKTVFIACEEDMEDALMAAKMGVRTFSSEWLMNCVMRQELDLEAHQFSESL